MGHRHGTRGQALVIAYMVVGALTILGGSLLGKSLAASRHSEIQRLHSELFYVAQGGVEDAIAQFSNAIANYQIDENADRYPDAGTLTTAFAPSASFPDPDGDGVGATASSVVEAQGDQTTVTNADGTMMFVRTYLVTTTATHPRNGTVMATVNQLIIRRLIYTFQHAVFYEDDLEWLPGPTMTLSGRVHSNSDMYLGTHNTLTIDSEYVHAAGDIYNRRKDSETPMAGDVTIKVTGSSTFEEMDGLDSDDPNWATESQTRWNGTVQTGVHGVTEMAVPSVGSIEPGGFYDQNAHVRVVNGAVTDNGTPLVEGVDIPPGTIQTTTSFYNNREGLNVKMTNIDIMRLAGYYDVNGDEVLDPPGTPGNPYTNHLPDNGLLYATRDDVPDTQQPGVRLINGSTVDRDGGLTVVTNVPLYIQGDYNTVNKQATAVIADAVNVLSNGWDDVNSTSEVDDRVAQNTTINTAFLAGIDTTTDGAYNGGLENYPRLHEKWSGKTLTIYGSFVALWNSQIATGAWQYGDPQYKAPNRNWYYDTDFSSGDLPPFTPWAVEIERRAWWKE